jgi:putative transposase
MRDMFTLFLHVIVILFRLARPGGLRSVVAESVLMRHQVLILNRDRKRAPNLLTSDRITAGLCTLLMRLERVLRSAGVLKVSTLMHFHKMLTKQKYHLLFSPKGRSRPGPKGPRKEWIDAVVEMKRRNLTWGCKRIAQQITLAFGVDIDKDGPVLREARGDIPRAYSPGLDYPFLDRQRNSRNSHTGLAQHEQKEPIFFPYK